MVLPPLTSLSLLCKSCCLQLPEGSWPISEAGELCMCLFCIGNPPCRSRLGGSQFQQCDCHSLRWAPAYPCENRAAPGCPKGTGARGLGWTGRLLALEGAAKSPLPQHHLRPQGLGMSQESCQPYRARPCQAQACAGCLGRAQGDGSRLRPPRWANSLFRTSMGVAWGTCCMSPLAPAASAGHQSNQLTCMHVAEMYCLTLSQKNFLLKVAPC